MRRDFNKWKLMIKTDKRNIRLKIITQTSKWHLSRFLLIKRSLHAFISILVVKVNAKTCRSLRDRHVVHSYNNFNWTTLANVKWSRNVDWNQITVWLIRFCCICCIPEEERMCWIIAFDSTLSFDGSRSITI